MVIKRDACGDLALLPIWHSGFVNLVCTSIETPHAISSDVGDADEVGLSRDLHQ